jgi:hypothetical protein
MTDRKHVRALLLCAGFILVLFVSSAFLIHEADHDCCGEDCPICRTIAMTTALMRAFLMIAAVWLLSFAMAAATSARNGSDTARFGVSDTPVSRKIRMNN